MCLRSAGSLVGPRRPGHAGRATLAGQHRPDSADGTLLPMSDAQFHTPDPGDQVAPEVLLMAAPVPYVGLIAHHCWFIVESAAGCSRWEVWQHRDVGGTSWGYLHRNLLSPRADVGAGGVRQLAAWTGDEAAALAQNIESSPQRYPYCQRYLLLPGPNSNTWVAWILARVDASLMRAMGPRALGKGFAKWIRGS